MSEVPRRVVEVHVFRIRPEGPEHLVLTRSPAHSDRGTRWQVIHGKVRHHETYFRAAGRELLEETGLVASRWWYSVAPDVYFDMMQDRVVASPVFVAEVSNTSRPVLGLEHESSVWATTSHALSLLEGHQALVTDLVSRMLLGEKTALLHIENER